MRSIAAAVVFCLLLSLCSCGSAADNTVTFYYCREAQAYQYFDADGVIASENREITGHENDLDYLVSLYLAGPLEEELISPFPRNTRRILTRKSEDSIHIELTDTLRSMTDASFSLACACLSKTCFSFAPCSQVTIVSGSRSITMHADQIILSDSGPTETTNGGTS